MTIKHFPNYSITESGIITNLKSNRQKKPVFDKQTGYYKIILWDKNKYKSYNLHYLIAIHFIDNIQNKPHINHINGIKTDNRIENLEWCTMSENARHSLDILGKNKFSDRHNFRGAIHSEYGIFCTYREAAQMSNVSKATMLDWLNGNRFNKSKFIWSE